jgi:hypothetical protein
MSYIGQGLGQGKAERFIFTASGSETSVTLDDAGRGVAYTVGQVDVYLNGVKLVNGTDFTATSGSSITGLSALAASDVVEIVALDAFSPADTVSAASGGSFGDAVTITDASNNPLTLNRTTSDGDIQVFQKDGTQVGSISSVAGVTAAIDGGGAYTGLQFKSTTLTPRKSGASSNGGVSLGESSYPFNDLYLSGGVYLGGTGSANYLDDYEEGTWTPTISGATLSGGTILGSYVKVGGLATVTMRMSVVTLSSASGIAKITNLPFTSINSGEGYHASAILGFNNGTTAGSNVGMISSNSTEVNLYVNGGAGTATFSNTSGVYLVMTISYRTA